MPRHLSKHHRRPRSLNGLSTPENISIVDIKKHQAYHTLFNNMEAPEICKVLNRVWIDPSYVFICVRKEEEVVDDRPISELEMEYYYDLYKRRKE